MEHAMRLIACGWAGTTTLLPGHDELLTDDPAMCDSEYLKRSESFRRSHHMRRLDVEQIIVTYGGPAVNDAEVRWKNVCGHARRCAFFFLHGSVEFSNVRVRCKNVERRRRGCAL